MNTKISSIIRISAATLALLVVIVLIFQLRSNSCSLSDKTDKAKNNCYIKTAAKNNDEKYCSLLENQYEPWGGDNLMGACYTELAVINKDASYCKKITGRYLDIVKSQCYTSVAFAQNEPKICEQDNSEYGNSFCYSWFSDITKDPNHCLNIKDANEQLDCVWRHKNNSLSETYFFCDEFVSQKAIDACNQVGIVRGAGTNKTVNNNGTDPTVDIATPNNDNTLVDTAVTKGSMNQQNLQTQTYRICNKEYTFQSIAKVNGIDLIAKFASLTKTQSQSQKEVCTDLNTLFNNKTIGVDLKEQQKTYYLTLYDISDGRYIQQIEMPTATVSYSWETNAVYYFPSTLQTGNATYIGSVK